MLPSFWASLKFSSSGNVNNESAIYVHPLLFREWCLWVVIKYIYFFYLFILFFSLLEYVVHLSCDHSRRHVLSSGMFPQITIENFPLSPLAQTTIYLFSCGFVACFCFIMLTWCFLVWKTNEGGRKYSVVINYAYIKSQCYTMLEYHSFLYDMRSVDLKGLIHPSGQSLYNYSAS